MTHRGCELGLCQFWSLQSGPVGSRAAIRLLAGTEAMPPWDEGCRRADEKRLKVLRRTARQPRAPKKRCKTQPIAHPSARKATRVLPTTLRRLTLFPRRASHRTPCFHRSTYRFLPVTRTNARRRTPAVAAAEAKAREHVARIAHDETRRNRVVTRRSREKPPHHP